MESRRQHIRLYCYSRPIDSGRHVAVCLTLNLVAEGRTQREAKHKLHELIKAYITDAVQDNEFDEFVPRRAPVRFYFEYMVCWAIHSMMKILSAPHDFCAFTDRHQIPAHA